MKINDVFYSRDKSFAKVNLAMNYLSRLVRENMTVFDYDSATNAVSFLTDSDKLVKCDIAITEGNVYLKNIMVGEASEVFSNIKIDGEVSDRVSTFIKSLHENSYTNAENEFSNVLEAFEGRSKITEARSKLEKQRARFNETQNIIDTPEYKKLFEVRENVKDYLTENKKTLLQYEDVVNSLKLTNALSKAFNLPKNSWENIVESRSILVPYDSKRTVFEMICTQELIRAELVESKESFSKTWVNNPKITKLASCIYSDDSVVVKALEEAVASVPYLALSSKADIKRVFASIYERTDVNNISQKDIREYVSRIFEAKKDVKRGIIKELNESYGINVQNLKFVPTFSNLAKAQSVLFEALSKIGEGDSIVKDVFSDFAKVIHKKNGIQTLEVNDVIGDIFEDAGIAQDQPLFRDADLDTVVTNVLEKKDAKEEPSKKDKFPEEKEDKFGGNKGDKSKTHKGKDFEKNGDEKNGDENGDPDAFGGKKGDKSKTHKGEDFEDEEGGKGKKKKKKNGKNGDEDDMEDDQAYDESMIADPEEDDVEMGGLGDEEMTNLMGELESLFKEIDWEAIADEEEDSDLEDDGNDYNDQETDREFENDGVDTPDEEDMPS